ncbi:MAG: metalloregulator ArsR/SmtB family transcription factor [Planctomycetota bacterium]
MDERLDTTWKALSDPTRRAVLDLLRNGPMTTGELGDHFPELSRFGVMKHLRVLEDAGLLLSRKEGRRRVNRLNAVPLREVYERWVGKFEDKWAGALLGLRRAAERGDHMQTADSRIAKIEQQITIKATPEAVFRAFTEDTEAWFFNGPGQPPCRLEPKLGGMLYQDEGDGAGTVFAMITKFKPGKAIAMSGEFCCREACLNNVTFTFEDADGATLMKLDHRLSGEFDDNYLEEFRVGWEELAGALKTHVEG